MLYYCCNRKVLILMSSIVSRITDLFRCSKGAKMPDFYANLTNAFHEIADARALVDAASQGVDKCMNIITALMEQASHMRTEIQDVPTVPPLAPPYVWSGPSNACPIPAVELPSSTVLGDDAESVHKPNLRFPDYPSSMPLHAIPEDAKRNEDVPLPASIVVPASECGTIETPFEGVRYDTAIPASSVGIVKYE